jgi:2-oxoglutarate dehydrogenase E2 component (dihydrolipoamide succinyltransferase)
LNTIKGTGLNDRLTKNDVLKYLEDKKDKNTISNTTIKEEIQIANKTVQPNYTPKTTTQLEDTIIEMDRVRKIISKNMLDSKRISAHVSSFVECDITNIVKWRNKNKDNFKLKYGFNLTYLPVFIEAIAQCIKEFPNINVSINDEKIIYKKNINIGIATALPNGNLIVPVIKDADKKNILGIASEINSLVDKARNNKLTTDDISDGTYTVSNIGSFGNILGTPIIVQPQVAIMAIGVATKKPVVIEIDGEDVIAIRHMLYLSHTYDHRIIDGMLGGTFVKRVADYLQAFNSNKEI